MINRWGFLQCPIVLLYKSTKSLTEHNTITLIVFFLKHCSLKHSRFFVPTLKRKQGLYSFHRTLVTSTFLFVFDESWLRAFSDKMLFIRLLLSSVLSVLKDAYLLPVHVLWGVLLILLVLHECLVHYNYIFEKSRTMQSWILSLWFTTRSKFLLIAPLVMKREHGLVIFKIHISFNFNFARS